MRRFCSLILLDYPCTDSDTASRMAKQMHSAVEVMMKSYADRSSEVETECYDPANLTNEQMIALTSQVKRLLEFVRDRIHGYKEVPGPLTSAVLEKRAHVALATEAIRQAVLSCEDFIIQCPKD